MSAIAFLIACAIALVATLVRAAINGGWDARGLAADFGFALVILVAPLFLHA